MDHIVLLNESNDPLIMTHYRVKLCFKMSHLTPLVGLPVFGPCKGVILDIGDDYMYIPNFKKRCHVMLFLFFSGLHA